MKRFILLYVFYMLLAFFLVDYKPMHDALQLDYFYTGSVVFLSKYLIELIGIDVVAKGAFLHLDAAIMEVKFGCNGLEAILLFAAAVLAFPASWRERIIGIFAGSTLIQLFNLVRISLLAYVLEEHHEYFAIMHEYITQSIMIAIAFAVFMIYLQWIQHEPHAQPA